MAISRARRNFRIFLGVLLLLSMGFFSASAYLYVNVKQRNIRLSDVAPTLFKIDIYQYYALSYINNQDGQHDIAKHLYRKGMASGMYTKAGFQMMDSLAMAGHAPSQVFQANVLMTHGDEEEKVKAKAYYMNAAAQGYAPAIEKLAFLRNQE